MKNKIINYFIYGFYIIIGLFILHHFNKLIAKIISEHTINLILELGIVIIQADNFSLLYDYKNLKNFYEKLIKDEYRICKLTRISNNLLERYQKLEETYFDLLHSNDIDKNKIKVLNIDIVKYISIYNRFEYKLNILKNKINSSKSEIFERSLLYNKNKIRLAKSEENINNKNEAILLYPYNNKNELRLLNYNDNDNYDIFIDQSNSSISDDFSKTNSSISDPFSKTNSPNIEPFNSSNIEPFRYIKNISNSPNIEPFNSPNIEPFNSPNIEPFRYKKNTSKSFSINKLSETKSEIFDKSKLRLYKSENNIKLFNNFIEEINEEIKIIKENTLPEIKPKLVRRHSLNLNELYEKCI